MILNVPDIGTAKQPEIPGGEMGVIPAGITYTYNGVVAKTPFAASIPSASGCPNFNMYFWSCYYLNPRVWFMGGYDPFQDLVTDAIEEEWCGDPNDGHNNPNLG